VNVRTSLREAELQKCVYSCHCGRNPIQIMALRLS
jgi:hypothetical protein